MSDDQAGVLDPILGLAGVRDPVGVLTVMASVSLGARSDAIPGRRAILDALAELDLSKDGVPDGEVFEAYRGGARRSRRLSRISWIRRSPVGGASWYCH